MKYINTNRYGINNNINNTVNNKITILFLFTLLILILSISIGCKRSKLVQNDCGRYMSDTNNMLIISHDVYIQNRKMRKIIIKK